MGLGLMEGAMLPWKKANDKKVRAGNTNWKGKLSTVDLLIKVTHFVKE